MVKSVDIQNVDDIVSNCLDKLKLLGIDFDGENDNDINNMLMNVGRLFEKASGDSESTVKVDLPTFKKFNELITNQSYNDLAFKNNISIITLKEIIFNLKLGYIPILQGNGGIGKTHMLSLLSDVVFKLESEMYPEFKFLDLRMYRVNCTRFSKTEFTRGLDAVSNKCEGVFSQIWSLALENKTTIYYLILDEIYNTLNIREVFGEYFSLLDLNSRPKNLVILATGNPDAKENQTTIVDSIRNDSGIARRFKQIDITNILVDRSSDEYVAFFQRMRENSNVYSSELIDLFFEIDKNYISKMAIPSKVLEFCKSTNLSGMSITEWIETEFKYNIPYIETMYIDKPKETKCLIDSKLLDCIYDYLEGGN